MLLPFTSKLFIEDEFTKIVVDIMLTGFTYTNTKVMGMAGKPQLWWERLHLKPDEGDGSQYIDKSEPSVNEFDMYLRNNECREYVNQAILQNLNNDLYQIFEHLDQVATKGKFGVKKALPGIIDLINSFIGNWEGTAWLRSLTFIHEKLRKMQQDVQVRYKYRKEKSETASVKLVWTAGPSVLGTLFYDLLYNLRIKGMPLISATIPEIEKFIIDNFWHGDERTEFSPDSLKTYLRPDKEDRRASVKARIVISFKE